VRSRQQPSARLVRWLFFAKLFNAGALSVRSVSSVVREGYRHILLRVHSKMSQSPKKSQSPAVLLVGPACRAGPEAPTGANSRFKVEIGRANLLSSALALTLLTPGRAKFTPFFARCRCGARRYGEGEAKVSAEKTPNVSAGLCGSRAAGWGWWWEGQAISLRRRSGGGSSFRTAGRRGGRRPPRLSRRSWLRGCAYSWGSGRG